MGTGLDVGMRLGRGGQAGWRRGAAADAHPTLRLLLPAVAGALWRLPEVKLEGTLGGSVTIECPLPTMPGRLYLCREVDEPRSCVTVISTNFVRKGYRDRVALKLCPDQNRFLVEVNELIESDSGVYACGAGSNTDRGKTQQVTLDVHSGRCPRDGDSAHPGSGSILECRDSNRTVAVPRP